MSASTNWQTGAWQECPATQTREFSFPWGKMKWMIGWWFGGASFLNCCETKLKLSHQAKLLIYHSVYAPTELRMPPNASPWEERWAHPSGPRPSGRFGTCCNNFITTQAWDINDVSLRDPEGIGKCPCWWQCLLTLWPDVEWLQEKGKNREKIINA